MRVGKRLQYLVVHEVFVRYIQRRLPADHAARDYRGTSLIRNCTPPQDHYRALDINLL